MRKRIVVVVLSLCLLLIGSGIGVAISSGGGFAWGGATHQAVDERSFAVSDAPTLALVGENGAITITRADDDAHIIVRAIRRANSEEALRRLTVVMRQDGNRITAEAPSDVTPFTFFGSGPSVSYEVQAPAHTTIATAHTFNGPVSVTGVAGSMNLETSNGAVAVRDFDGALSVHTSNGSVTLTNGRGPTQVEASNGAVRLEGVQTQGLNVHTANGRIEFAGSLAPGSQNRVETSNGAVGITLPSESGFALDARTSNGGVSLAFPLTTTTTTTANGEKPDRNTLQGTVGRPDATLAVRSSNGTITIGKQG